MIALDPRSTKALQIAATASQWTRFPTGAFCIPSQSNPRHGYVCTAQMCDCPDAERHPERLCKHSIAVSIVLALLETQPQPEAVRVLPPITDDQAARIFGRL